MNLMHSLRRRLGSRTLVDKHGKIVGEETGLEAGLKNLAGFLLRQEVVLAALVGMLCWNGGRAYQSKNQANYHPRQAVVYEGEAQIDREFQLLRDPNSNPSNDSNLPTIYKRWDQF